MNKIDKMNKRDKMITLNCDYCDKKLKRAVKVCLVVRDYRKTYTKSKKVFIQTDRKDLCLSCAGKLRKEFNKK